MTRPARNPEGRSGYAELWPAPTEIDLDLAFRDILWRTQQLNAAEPTITRAILDAAAPIYDWQRNRAALLALPPVTSANDAIGRRAALRLWAATWAAMSAQAWTRATNYTDGTTDRPPRYDRWAALLRDAATVIDLERQQINQGADALGAALAAGFWTTAPAAAGPIPIVPFDVWTTPPPTAAGDRSWLAIALLAAIVMGRKRHG